MLLYNYGFRFCFAWKLLSKWKGPYVVEEVYRSGAIKISKFKVIKPSVVNGQIKNSIMTSNLPVKRGYLILAHYMNGEPKLMKMPNCLKKRLKVA